MLKQRVSSGFHICQLFDIQLPFIGAKQRPSWDLIVKLCKHTGSLKPRQKKKKNGIKNNLKNPKKRWNQEQIKKPKKRQNQEQFKKPNLEERIKKPNTKPQVSKIKK